MLIDGMTSSETFRQTIIRVGNDPKNTITVDLGRNQPGVFVDGFDTNQVDLNDIGQLPTAPRAGHHNELTQSEVILHFLEERHHSVANNTGFDPAHKSGVNLQNTYRAEIGQSPVQKQHIEEHPDGVTGNTIFKFKDHTREVIQIDSLGNVLNITPPNDPKQQQKQSGLLLESVPNTQSVNNGNGSETQPTNTTPAETFYQAYFEAPTDSVHDSIAYAKGITSSKHLNILQTDLDMMEDVVLEMNQQELQATNQLQPAATNQPQQEMELA
jgi:hypothetical protein